ncbi:MAG: hypothetical protein DRP25_01385 [Thermotoga sp.]|nr:MAG: hypothetical protein DRP25_01385 [Thermotoga sp.]
MYSFLVFEFLEKEDKVLYFVFLILLVRSLVMGEVDLFHIITYFVFLILFKSKEFFSTPFTPSMVLLLVSYLLLQKGNMSVINGVFTLGSALTVLKLRRKGK